MAVRRQASFNPTLTNYGQGVAQDLKTALAEFMAPTVQVGSTVGQYKKYDDKNAFQIHETERAVGGAARRIEFSSTDPVYNCRPHALEIPIDDSETDAAGEQATSLRMSKTKTLVTSAVLSRENRVITIAKGLTAAAGKGVWSNTSTDPVAELDEQIEAIATKTGMMPNRIVFGLGGWRVFRNHPKVVAKQPGAALIGVTEDQAAKMLLNPGISIKVGVLSKDTSKFGAAATKVNIVGAEVFIFIASDSPTEYDPSWLKTFSGARGSVSSVREYYDDRARSQILAVDFSEQIVQVSDISAARLTIS
ncbi:MAG TPA: hypothetical protein VEH27_00040 [Methylomirabilota bacterium]|nr:hypothetical protein [Methylomirabilota bacterium]